MQVQNVILFSCTSHPDKAWEIVQIVHGSMVIFVCLVWVLPFDVPPTALVIWRLDLVLI